MSNKNKNKSGSKSSDSKSSSSSSPPAAAAAATNKKVIERRPVLVLYGSKISDAKTEVARISTSLESWVRQTDIKPETTTKLTELIALAKEISPRLDEFHTSFASLAALGFVPETVQVRAPKFGPGVKVRVEAGDWMTHYTKSGIYTAAELSDLTVVKVTATRELLCKTAGGREVVIRTAGHLETLDGAKGTDESTAPETAPETSQGATA
jgi:hypothetical protein